MPQTGVGVIASFDFTRDRELWRWVPASVTLFMSRTAPVPVSDTLGVVSALNRPGLLKRPTREVCTVGAEAVCYLCTACTFVGGLSRERALVEAMLRHGAPRAVTTARAVVDALRAVGAARVAVAHPYETEVGDRLADFLSASAVDVVSQRGLNLPFREIPRSSTSTVAQLIRESDHPAADAVFISCTALPTYDVIAPLEAELGKPVISANQASIWAVLGAVSESAQGPSQSLLSAQYCPQ